MTHRQWRNIAAAAAVFACGLSAQSRAQEDGAQDRPIYPVEFKEDERFPGGKSAFIHGTTDEAGYRFVVEGTALDEPVAVTVLTREPGDAIKVRIVKDDWDKAEREDSTAGKGRADFRFRTYDGFKIGITSATPTDYQLLVWIGEAIPPDVPSIAVPASEYVAPAGAGAGAGAAAGSEPAAARTDSPSNGISLSWLELGLILTLLATVIGFGVLFATRRKSS